jgi:HlyD family type I secretion membrane fusion protein
VVVDVRTVTLGGVIGPGQPLMDIIPVGDELTIETKISPTDIERVYPGLTAEMKLSAYKRSNAPMIEGTVTFVSADKLVDPRTGEPYFLVRVRPDPASLAAVKEFPISPGMPLEVMVNTGRRRAIDYFLEPVTSRLRRAMHED